MSTASAKSSPRDDNARAIQFRVRAPKELAKYIAHKGSITVDGTSLTVNAVNGAEFELTIVPAYPVRNHHGRLPAGRKVNLEVDLLARYLERLLLGDKAAEPSARRHHRKLSGRQRLPQILTQRGCPWRSTRLKNWSKTFAKAKW